MKVTRAQAQENRSRVVETASILFRERGYDGVGVAELMSAAGLTHGGFYGQFRSKSHLMAEASTCGIAQTIQRSGSLDVADFFDRYVSRIHRDNRAGGCTIAALSGDVARQPDDVKGVFSEGIESLLQMLQSKYVARREGCDPEQAREKAISMFTQAVGAIVLSRACPSNSALVDEILEMCRNEILGPLSSDPITDC